MVAKTQTASGQRNILRTHLLEHESLTTQYARDSLGVPHPAGRICELRKEGMDITTSSENECFSDGSIHRMAKYILQEAKND